MADPYTNMNYSYSAGIKPTLVETYLQRKAMKNVTPKRGWLYSNVLQAESDNRL